MKNPFRYFNSSPDVIRVTVMLYIRYPLSLHQVEDILFEPFKRRRWDALRARGWQRPVVKEANR